MICILKFWGKCNVVILFGVGWNFFLGFLVFIFVFIIWLLNWILFCEKGKWLCFNKYSCVVIKLCFVCIFVIVCLICIWVFILIK